MSEIHPSVKDQMKRLRLGDYCVRPHITHSCRHHISQLMRSVGGFTHHKHSEAQTDVEHTKPRTHSYVLLQEQERDDISGKPTRLIQELLLNLMTFMNRFPHTDLLITDVNGTEITAMKSSQTNQKV